MKKKDKTEMRKKTRKYIISFESSNIRDNQIRQLYHCIREFFYKICVLYENLRIKIIDIDYLDKFLDEE